MPFRKLFDFILAYPKTLILAVLGLVVYGWHVAGRLPVDVFPDIQVPRVVIQTEAGGLTAEEVEQRVTVPIEAAVNGIPGVSTIRSSSGGGLSFVWIDFDWATDLSRARFDVFERLSRVKESLPAEADPEIAPVVSVTGEIMLVALTAPTNGLSLLELRELAEYDLRTRLLGVPGIGEVVVLGGRLPEYRIRVAPRRLAEYGLSVDDVIEAARASRTSASAGYLPNVGGDELPLRQIARADSLEALRRLPVTPGSALRLGDVADVALDGAPRRGSASFDGVEAVVLSIQKTPGGNTPELTKALDAVLDGFAAETAGKGVEVRRNAYRQADFIGVSVDGGKQVVRDAAVVVVVVLGLTLLKLRTILIVLVTMPVTVLLGLLLFPALGLGVNVMTLGGFAVAAGDVVDAAIIFTEVVWRRLGENAALPPGMREPVRRVIASAAASVLPGVLFSTVVIVLVFLPLLMLSGLEGRFFQPLGLAYLSVFGMSFLVALALVPALSRLLWRNRAKAASARAGESLVTRLMKAVYRPLLRACLWAPVLVVLLAGALCAGAAYVAAGFGSSFLPSFREDAFNVMLSLPPGASLDETERVSEACGAAIRTIPGVLSVTRRTGRAERDQHAEPVSSSEYVVRLDRAGNPDAVRDEIRRRLGGVPGCSAMVGFPIEHRIGAVLSGTEAELAINVFGEDSAVLRDLVAKFKGILGRTPGVADVRANREITVRTLRIDYDLEALAEAGLTLRDAGEQVSAAFNGVETGEVRDGLRRRAVVVRLDGADAGADVSTVKKLLLTGKGGRSVRLDEVARVAPEEASNLMLREGGRRKALISCNCTAGTSVGDLVAQLRGTLDPVARAAGCTVGYGGSYAARESAARRLAVLGGALLAAIFGILLLALRDVRAALLALLNVPLGLVGGVAAVWIADPVLSVSSLVGFVTVAGFTLRNGLLLLNCYRERLAAGEPLARAVEEGSVERMVPILMTSLTTVLGLVPIVLAGSKPGGELLAPLAVVQFGGILGATLLNLVVLPAAAKLLRLKAGDAPEENA